jgi:transcriptional regulator with GAF, ATPase, and Fis domain
MTDRTPIFVTRGTTAPKRRGWVVSVLQSPDQTRVGQQVPLIDVVTFGRAAIDDVNFKIDDALLSRRHASILAVSTSPPVLEVTDHDSTNGTFADGEKIKTASCVSDTVVRAGETLLFITQAAEATPPWGALLGTSAVMQTLRHEIRTIAPSPLPVLIRGETGTGKELAAAALHAERGRQGKLVPVNCSAVPDALAEAQFFGHRKGAFTGAVDDAPGFWQLAHQGTLFLDEVGDLSLDLQPKLLRALDSGEVTPVGGARSASCDVRVIAATNLDLEAKVAKGEFRRDLYARLAGYTLETPPLHTRRDDVLLLLRHFMSEARQGHLVDLSIEVAESLVLYDWPMNMRELRALAYQFALHQDGAVLGVEALPKHLREGSSGPAELQSTGRPTKEQLDAALVQHQGNIALVAQHFASNRVQIYRWMRRFGLNPDAYRA